MIRLRSFDTTYRGRASNGSAFAQNKRARIARQALIMGIIAGSRSMMPLALLSSIDSSGGEDTSGVSHLLHSQQVRIASGLAAAGEIIGDKLPITPSRLSPGPLLGRMVIGALAGMEICRRGDEPVIMGAALGATAAGAGAFVGYTARTLLSQTTNIPDVIWAGIEDITALALGYTVVSQQ